MNFVDGKLFFVKDLIKFNFVCNVDINNSNDCNGIFIDGKGDFIDFVIFKVFIDNIYIVVICYGNYVNVFVWEIVEWMNIKFKMWCDFVDDVEFGCKDIIIL